MKRLLVAFASLLALGACETPTPYQPLNAPNAEASGGFSEQQIEANRWRVSFAGNDLTSRERVERYLLFRAAQLTLQQGYDWFTTVQRHTHQTTSFIGDSFGPWGGYWGPDWGFYRRGFGWGYGGWRGAGLGWGDWGEWGPGWGGGPVEIDQVTQFKATAEIVLGHGPKPADDPRAFDARSVIQHLQGTIVYPKGAPQG